MCAAARHIDELSSFSLYLSTYLDLKLLLCLILQASFGDAHRRVQGGQIDVVQWRNCVYGAGTCTCRQKVRSRFAQLQCAGSALVR
jgi:hypothetical protein